MWRSGERIVLRCRAVDGHCYAGRPLRVIEDGPERTVAWEDWRPPADWTVPELPGGWDA